MDHFPRIKPTLKEFITSPDVDFDIAQATPLEERTGNLGNSSFTGFFLHQMEFTQKEARSKNIIIESLFTTNSFVTTNFSPVNLKTLKFLLRAAQINQTIQVISLWGAVV